jgi:uncharacterized membrane protein
MSTREQGSTIPLILGFFLIALLLVAGSVAAGDAFVQQRSLQDVCDGAAVDAASQSVDLARDRDPTAGGAIRFADVQTAVLAYLARDPSRSGVHVVAALSPDARTLTLTCTQTTHIAFGALFGRGAGVHHTVTSSARAPVS